MAASSHYRQLLCLAADESDTEYEDLLFEAALKRKPVRSRLHLKGLSEFVPDEVTRMARFSVQQIRELRTALRLPNDIVIQPEAYRINGDDALFLTLRRLSYPCRLRDLSREFNSSKAKVGAVCNYVINFIYDTWHHLLSVHESRFGPEKLRRFARITELAGSPIRRCVGFIDGTCRPICRPQKNQRLLFSGHKRVHAIKFQSVVTPDGIISHLAGPYPGHRHDLGLLSESGLLAHMRTHFRDADGSFVLYGDAGYTVSGNLISSIRGAHVTDEQNRLNLLMSRLRVAVEWRFGEILRDFAFVDFRKNLKLYLQPVGKLYVVCALLSNCKCCLQGNSTSDLFRTEPPTLNEYLQPRN